MDSQGKPRLSAVLATIGIVVGVVGTVKLAAQEGPVRHPFGAGRPEALTRGEAIAATQTDTSLVLCNASTATENTTLGFESIAHWRCVNGQRLLSSNGIPNHPPGTFPNEHNPNRISEQQINFATTLNPIARSDAGAWVRTAGYAINGVKFEPGTAGRCESSITNPKQCNLGRGFGQWSIEALGQNSFDFGVDANRAHVQPTGEYHYHGIPEGLLSPQSKEGRAMQLIGWAADGFPIYARYGYADPASAQSPLKAMRTSYSARTAASAGRPSVDLVPMGAFEQDYRYEAGAGDLDECNGRYAVTPEFPKGSYHYYATDAYPYVQRCVKGTPAPTENRRPPRGRPS